MGGANRYHDGVAIGSLQDQCNNSHPYIDGFCIVLAQEGRKWWTVLDSNQ